ncbi:MAG: hypothetical protein A3C70_01370 [Candidatus Zambryskibacteria bacterium RIFCSPHIGHO2_02_FULL_43_14]|uniref:Phospholipid/glycerol acyltransferase domain-containing protein n=1 Tax=Candidatus Zambryskibacteria bacterium RIFCSPHIGHO2_02_FULL_43_14 TaxID=1802748 RepID=A0A1G2TFL2_9BACT|nr:MAG: hypothetical protein A2829_02620 [Candidatus Zambryskibacteria bacterium RIFCSPHIGHO2_01_FULL_43_60]OHA96060.1 MAG: hypothetical protein A3C70_01370 [Candidatus Zambryskibacteria bacterium RIFCSPHIGHO2_02_FULL_43_14]OHB02833.1 MAG: hypothetical protein A3B03_00260 [Candidatus Zambryskibacteria bacterium RIFCSPLOWO2_01_FULL_42_41]
MKKFTNVIILFLFTYPVGVLIGVIFWLLWLVGALEIKGWWKNFPRWQTRVVLISNHPYKGEQFLLAGLFFFQYLFQPLKHSPWIVADAKNYYNKWFCWFLRPRLIPVDRSGKNGDLKSLITAKNILRSDGNLIIFPEGGRTSKGKAFLTSKKGKRIRVPLKEGFVSLVTEPGVILLPVWFECNRWHDMRLIIGEPIMFTSGTPRNEVVERTERILLELADQTD